jgi:glycosyltransferase involved in cell wall biosynthesis/GT2 family glycosyltransferase
MRVLRIAHHGVVDAWRERERALASRGVDVRLISARRWNEGGQRVRLAPEREAGVIGAHTLGRHPSVFAFGLLALWRELGKSPQIVDLHEEPNSIAVAQTIALMRLRRLRSPVLLYSAQNIDKRFPLPFRWFERRALRRAHGAYVCNEEAGRILVRKGLIGPNTYIPLGVDTVALHPKERGAPGPHPVVGYVGRLEAHKGVDTLLQAAALSPNWRVQITGDGPERGRLLDLARSLGIDDRVDFLGFASGNDLLERYQALDVLAVPSRPTHGWLEQFCRVAVEAMAAGVPVVASDTGAIPDVIGAAGKLVTPDDPQEWARAVDAAVTPAEWSAMRQRGLARAPEFAWDRVAERHEALYREVLGQGAEREVHAVVVAYGPSEDLDETLQHLGGSMPVTVVDNSGNAATRAVCEKHGADYLDSGGNVGFAAGVNIALKALSAVGSTADVLLLNPDARVAPDGVEAMAQELRSDTHLAAVGAEQVRPGTQEPVRVWWPFPTPWGAWIEALGLGALRKSKGFAIGSVLLLRREAIDRIGTLDERFFLYAEEVDWQRRAKKAGWRIAVAPVLASHAGGATGGEPDRREAHFYASAERYVRKHYGSFGWATYRTANVVGAGLRALVLPGDRGDAARRRRKLFVDGPVNREAAWR